MEILILKCIMPNDGDFGICNAWEHFDSDSDSNKVYSEEFKSRVKHHQLR